MRKALIFKCSRRLSSGGGFLQGGGGTFRTFTELAIIIYQTIGHGRNFIRQLINIKYRVLQPFHRGIKGLL